LKPYIAISKLAYPAAIQRIENKENSVFLTFDDGPHPQITPHILYLLDKFNAKATFFCLGENVEKYPQLYEEIIKNGHSIGNHGYSHLDGFECNNDDFIKNAEKGYLITHSRLFRPPYGRMKPINYLWAKRRYKIILWDILSEDYREDLQAKDVVNNVSENIKSGSIIVFHDNKKAQNNLFEALPLILASYQQFNFEKITIK
jgi:peptidoglycan/xylan/chitin deacetylase (PgdA/CDA1 family)